MSDNRAVGDENLKHGGGHGSNQALVPVAGHGRELVAGVHELPDIVHRAGQAAVFAAEEFFDGTIRNENTRRAYRHAVDQFLAWCEQRGLELVRIAPKHAAVLHRPHQENLYRHPQATSLRARHFFDGLVTRHAIILNPALSVRGERYSVAEGKTPEITVPQARALLKSIDTSTVVGRRDLAMLAILVYTASRAGAVATLKRGSFYRVGDQSMLHFEEKGGKSREIPVRHDLEGILSDYLEAASLDDAPKDAALFPTAIRKTGQLTSRGIHVNDVCRMMKRRLKTPGSRTIFRHTLSA